MSCPRLPCPVPLPLTARRFVLSPHHATRRCDPNSLGVLTTRLPLPPTLLLPLRGNVRGPIPTRRHATAKTSVQSPLWKKNTYPSPSPSWPLLLFLSFPSSLVHLSTFVPFFVLSPRLSVSPSSATSSLPALRPGRSFFSVQRLLPSYSFSSGSSFFRGPPSPPLPYPPAHFASVYPLPERANNAM